VVTGTHHIAVVGMAGRFPGARDLDEFWANLHEGVESIQFPTDEELLAYGVPEEMLRHPEYVKAFATTPGVQDFDAALFGYTPREAESTDPQIRMFLECSHAALEHAGYDPHRTDATIAVYGSAGNNRYVDMHLGNAGDSSATSSFALTSLNNTDYVANTVAYKLNLRGPAISVSTACSSSLVAVHLASQALRNGECDLALAGGAEVEMPYGHGYLWAEGSPFSRDGHVRPFDVKADGTVFSTGVGVVVLKRLIDALADGDVIHAVLRGSALNNDGSAKAGFSAPSVTGQAVMLAEAMAMAEVDAQDISLVECHATGTQLGDPIEVAALHRAFRSRAAGRLGTAHTTLSSVKASVGHLGHAAGAASLIKVILSLAHQSMPGTVNFTEPNPKLELDCTPFLVTDRPSAWPVVAGRPRVAGVSSFGVGGTNAHVVVQEPPLRPDPPGGHQLQRPQVLVWSAKSEQARAAYRDRLATWFAQPQAHERFTDAVHTLAHGRRPYPIRGALVAADAAEAQIALRAGQGVLDGEGLRRELVFAFPGQGSQRPGMAVGLYDRDRHFATALDECLDAFADLGMEVRQAWRHADAEAMAATETAQPLLFAVEIALARTLDARGVRPSAVLGHSVGELAAAVVCGILPVQDGVRLVAARARAMAAAPPGAMLAVAAQLDAATGLAGTLPDGCTLAVVNGREQLVLSGSRQDIGNAAQVLRGRGLAVRQLPTSGAFHGPLMASAAAQFATAFEGITLAGPDRPFYSSAAGGLLSAAQATDPDFWAGQLCAPVRFDRALDAMLTDGARLVLEAGPGNTLCGLGRTADTAGTSSFRPVLPGEGGDPAREERLLLTALMHAWTEGHEVDLGHGDAPAGRIPLPGYPYQRQRHWVQPRTATPVAPPCPASQPAAPQTPDTPLSTIVWSQTDTPAISSTVDGHCVILAPQAAADSLPVVLAVQQAGGQPVVVRHSDQFTEQAGEFRVRAGSREDIDRLLAELDRRGMPVRLAIHATTLGEQEPLDSAAMDAAVHSAFDSLLVLSAAAAARPSSATFGVAVLTRAAVDVTGAEPLNPVASMLVAFARSLAGEAPQLGARVIDVASAAERVLAAEVASWREHEVVALRGSRRWVGRPVPYQPVLLPGAPTIRRGGVYLITGGTGGLGIAMARGLAGTGLRPRLLLISRTGTGPHADAGRDERLGTEIAELTALGAQVRVIAADVTDRRALRRALDTATARYGPVNGVLHLAGLPGDGLVRTRGVAAAARVLAPKVRGTVLLAEELRERPGLDFFVTFSSRAATDGLIGSADYAAANAFQDAHAQVLRRAGLPALSINWPSWAQVGLAASYGVQTWSTRIGAATSAIMDEHRIGGVAVLPGTGQLDVMLSGYTELTGRRLPVRLTDVVYHQMLSGEDERQLEVRLHPDGQLETSSRPVREPAAIPVRHVTAGVAAVADDRVPVDTRALRARLARPLVDADSGDRLFHLGRRWDNVVGTWTAADGDTTQLLVELRLPAEFHDDLDRHLIHPTLLDSATTASRLPADGFHLPFCCQSLVCYEPLPAHVLAHVRRQPAGAGIIRADVDLLAPEGRLLVRAIGYTLRKVDPDTAAAATGAAAGTAPPEDGIQPTHGVRITLDLLGADHPGQVLVEPGARPFVARPAEAPRTAAMTPLPATVSVTAAQPVLAAPPVPDAAGRLQALVSALWVEVIGDPSVRPDDDFFEAGGSSLTAVALIGRIREAFRVDVSISAIFDHPSIAALTALLQEQGVR
jgi:acyl transferase domain-containing protein